MLGKHKTDPLKRPKQKQGNIKGDLKETRSECIDCSNEAVQEQIADCREPSNETLGSINSSKFLND